ncbi:hypothetical protein [Nonomuraea sp. SYSU D8015]|uniref:hypothetical protein n=1 Tax=Nonomuraea sp. SYSU D8015 TaxID=2593644 RepID=UPI0016600D62|nr:hypothetical protein [Nonomuraea sp. SYSU D8015]
MRRQGCRTQTSGLMGSVVPEPVEGLSMELGVRIREWGGGHVIAAPPAEEIGG